MDYKEGFKGDYVAALDLPVGQEVTVKIVKVVLKKVADRKGNPRDRWILEFAGEPKPKPMILIRTNAECIVAMFGKDTDGWIGKSVTFAVETIQMWDEDDQAMKPTAAIRIVGSPELTQPLKFDLRLPRKNPKPTTLRPTGQRRQPAPARQPGQEG